MSRKRFLQAVISTEDKLRAIYNKAAKRIKRLPLTPASRSEARAIIVHADKAMKELIFPAMRKGAKMGSEEATRAALEEMVKHWKVKK